MEAPDNVLRQDETLKKRLFHRQATAVLILCLILIPTNLLRIFDTGFLPVYAIQGLAILICLGMFLFRRYLNPKTVALTITAVMVIGLLAGVATFGILAAGHSMIPIVIVLASILFGRRAGIWLLAIFALGLVVIAALHMSGILHGVLTAQHYVHSWVSWLVLFVAEVWAAAGYLFIFQPIVETQERTSEYLAAVFQGINDALFIHDKDTGVILQVNEKMCAMYGYSAEEATRLRVEDLSAGVPPYTQKEAQAWMSLAVKQGPQLFEWRAKDRAGRLFWVEVGMRLANLEGPERLLVVVRDISARKQAKRDIEDVQANLRESEARFNTAFQFMPVGAGITTLREGRFLAVNKHFGEVFGYTEAELLGHTTNEIDIWVNPEDRAYVVSMLQIGQPVHAYECQIRRKDGSQGWVSYSGDLVVLDGEQHLLSGAVDITKRKRAELELQDTTRRYETLVENSPDIIARFDRDLRYEFVNSAIAQVSPLKPADFKGKTMAEVGFTREQAEKRELLIREAIASRIPAEAELEFTVQGERRVYEWRAYPELGSAGTVQSVLTINRDITKRKRTEETLRESEERHRTVLQVAMDGFFLADAEGRLLEVNDAYSQMSGYSRQELLGMRIDDLRPPEPPDRVRARIQMVMSQGEHRFESVHQRKNGTLFDVEVSAQFRAFEGGRLVVFLRDITERKRAEESIALLKHSIDVHSDVAVWIDDQNKITYVNEAGCRTLGFGPGELLGKELSVINRLSTPERMTEVWNALRKDGYWRSESVLQRKDAGEFPVEIATSYVSFCGREYACGFAHDITRRKRAEEEHRQLQARLGQAQKMEAIGTLAGGIAHDFNNILSAILGCNDLAMQKCVDEEQLDDLKMVGQAARRAVDLVKQILDFSHMSKEEAKPVQPKLIVREALKLLRASIPSMVEIRDNLVSKALVLAEPGEIHRMVINLCTNAALAMEGTGGILDLGLDEVELDAQFVNSYPGIATGRFVRLTVKDTGCGMTEEVKARIFEPYFTTRPSGEGTGMGLAVVHGVVHNRGGTLSVASTPGQGTTFQVFLPVATLSTAVEDLSEELPPTGSERILLVDDEPILVDVASRSLARLGYKVTPMTSSLDAVERFKTAPGDFDVVVTDMTMPKMTGAELAEAIRTIRPDIPIILCSGYSERLRSTKAGGIDAFAYKPVAAGALSRLIRKVLQDRSASRT